MLKLSLNELNLLQVMTTLGSCDDGEMVMMLLMMMMMMVVMMMMMMMMMMMVIPGGAPGLEGGKQQKHLQELVCR